LLFSAAVHTNLSTYNASETEIFVTIKDWLKGREGLKAGM
jgi:hypothetical protein